MKHRKVDGVTYYPRTHKENGLYYAVVEFIGILIHETYYLTPPQPTRSKARTIAVNHIKSIK